MGMGTASRSQVTLLRAERISPHLFYMTNIIVIAVLLMPWIFLPDVSVIDQMRLPKAIFFDLVCIAIIASSFINGQKFTYRNKWFGAMFLVLMFSFLMNWYIPSMLNIDGKRILNIWNLSASIHVLLAFVASYCAMSSLDRTGYIRIAKSICLSATLCACFGILQAVGFDPMRNITHYKNWEINHVAAILDHPNMLGNFLALSIPFFLLFTTPLYAIGALVCCLCLYFTQSSTSIMAFFLSMIAYFVIKNIRNFKVVLSVFGLLLILIAVVASNPSFNKVASGLTGRTPTWLYAIEKIKDNPAFGQGTGRFATFAFTQGTNIEDGYAGMRWEFVHNDYLEMIINIGFLGIVLFGFLVLNTFRNFNLSRENVVGFSYISSMVAFLVIMFGSFPMEFAPCALLGMIGFWGSEKL